MGLGDDDYLAREARARKAIDRQLLAAGWAVQSQNALNLSASAGVAVREFTLEKPHGRGSVVRLDGDSLEVQYRHVLTELGKYPGTLGVIFRKAQNKIQDPAKLGQHVRRRPATRRPPPSCRSHPRPPRKYALI